MRKAAPAFGLSALCLIVVWQALALRVDSPLVLPDARAVLTASGDLLRSAEFWRALGTTARNCVCAALVSVVAGGAAGLLGGASDFARDFLRLPLWIVKGTPVVALVLVALFWFRAATIPVFVASLLAVPVIAAATERGIRSADKKLLRALDLFGVRTAEQWRHVILPAARPFFLQGVASAYGLIWKAVAAGEVLAQPKHTLGTLLNQYQVHLETAHVFAVTAALIVAGFASEALFALAFRGGAGLLSRVRRNRSRPCTEPPAEGEGIAPFEPLGLSLPPLTVRYGEKTVLDGFAFSAPSGAVVALVARSGSGKTTLLGAIAEHLRAGQRPGERRTFSVVHQEPRLVEHLTLLQNVALPLKSVMDAAAAERRAYAVLERVSLAGLADRLPSQVSGGEKQRASLARAFAYPAPVLLMDEAFQSQDLATECTLLGALSALLRLEPRTVVLATHNVREACVLAQTVMVLSGPPLAVKKEIATGAAVQDSAARYRAPGAETVRLEREVGELLIAAREIHLPCQ